MSNDFAHRFEALQKSAARGRILSLRAALGEWAALVGFVEDGYEMGYDEYRNDLSVRRLLQVALDDGEMSAMPESAAFREEVEELDRRFRAVLLLGAVIGDERSPWWEQGVPRRGGPEFAADLKALHDISIEVVES